MGGSQDTPLRWLAEAWPRGGSCMPQLSLRKRDGSVRVWGGALLLLALGGCGGCGGKPSAPVAETEAGKAFYFRDVTAESGIDFAYRNGQEADRFSILESLGGGVALIDYDGDGLLDVFVTGGGYFAGPEKREIKGYPCRLYKNLGGWKFKDVTADVGLAAIDFYTHGAAVADFNRDGWPDLLVTGYGG